MKNKFKDTAIIPRPEYWGGWRVKPTLIEFWQSGSFRLHDRFVFSRKSSNDSWEIQRLFP